ncbi:hypothetical protein [Magnetococcus sp. PR-3]|uniref:hypothetical protein n=1 Tax=Magnetococcus sp. PR-3 TaxID=3120355 RepID=UPI002FCE0923
MTPLTETEDIIGQIITQAPALPAPPAAPTPATQPEVAVATAQPPLNQDTMELTLAPNQSAEIKLAMVQGDEVHDQWTGNGGRLNYDTHADPFDHPDAYHSYDRGRHVGRKKGVLKAPFHGYHGWFWRNRSQQTVTLNLQVEGLYQQIKRVK